MIGLRVQQVAALICCAGLLALSQAVNANDTYEGEWNEKYGGSSSSYVNAGCKLCHATSNSSSSLNAYGADIKAFAGTVSGKIAGVEGINSDNDTPGTTNLEEINASTQPGWTVSSPFDIGLLDPPEEDNVKPVITLKGDDPVRIYVGDKYKDAGAKATDDVDGNIKNSIVVSGKVKTGKVGAYVLSYDVMDSAGNPADTVTRTVYVDPTYESYDNFNTQKVSGCKYCIDPDKWRGSHRGDRNTETLREIKSKRLHLSQRSWGGTDSNKETEQGRNRLQFRNSQQISGVCVVPSVKDYAINNCKKNNKSDGRSRVRYLGNFYDTDNGDAGSEDGVVYAGINVVRYGDSNDKKGVFRVEGWVEECEGTDCETDAWSTYDGVNDPNLSLGTLKVGTNKKEICLGYDRNLHEFVFSFGSKVRRVDMSNSDLPAFGDYVEEDWSWHVLEVRNDVENCKAGPVSGYTEGEFDDVKVREFPPE